MTYRVLDLFSGIGGFSLGLERTGGFKTVAFCEIEPFCQRVLAKHWPGVPIYDDIRELTAERLLADGIVPDVLCGGFPCQDISSAGNKVGIGGARSGLWAEYSRLIGEIRPRYVIVENVAALLGRGLDRVLGDLAAFGFDAEWHCIPAAAVGAPHRRDRIWIVGNAQCERQPGEKPARPLTISVGAIASGTSQALADAKGERSTEAREYSERSAKRAAGSGEILAYANSKSLEWAAIAWPEHHPWLAEPDVGRVVDGVPPPVDELRSLGNAVVPQIPELIGRAILAAEDASFRIRQPVLGDSVGEYR